MRCLISTANSSSQPSPGRTSRSAEQWQTWRKHLKKPPREVIRGATNNWETYLMKGEWMRARAGLISPQDATTMIESAWRERQPARPNTRSAAGRQSAAGGDAHRRRSRFSGTLRRGCGWQRGCEAAISDALSRAVGRSTARRAGTRCPRRIGAARSGHAGPARDQTIARRTCPRRAPRIAPTSWVARDRNGRENPTKSAWRTGRGFHNSVSRLGIQRCGSVGRLRGVDRGTSGGLERGQFPKRGSVSARPRPTAAL